jgi:hypothetical protein
MTKSQGQKSHASILFKKGGRGGLALQPNIAAYLVCMFTLIDHLLYNVKGDG